MHFETTFAKHQLHGNMPNTALTSPVDTGRVRKMFNITFRASLLDEDISQWATWKESTCFTPSADSGYKVRVEGGSMDGIFYLPAGDKLRVDFACYDTQQPTLFFISPNQYLELEAAGGIQPQ